MQKLKFQSAWDKTIAEEDRKKIKTAFENVSLDSGRNIQFSTLWQAKNHRGELLVAVLVHNTSQEDFSFLDQPMTYFINDKIFAKHVFSPPIIVEKQTSMPWTFIFPKGSFVSNEPFECGELNFSS